MVEILQGDCLKKMKGLDDNTVDSIVTDPPYGIKFMAKKWDHNVPNVEIWQEALRVLKPGGHLLCACGTRTQHRMVVNIEDAGFEIRDVVTWMYGSGFPKSLNIGKAVDKLQGNDREVVGVDERFNEPSGIVNIGQGERKKILRKITKGNSEWEGWGTALKPACEFFTLARKPLSEKTVAENVLKWGTGGINIDDCRVGSDTIKTNGKGTHKNRTHCAKSKDYIGETHIGRFPANLIHDGSQEVLDLFPDKNSRFFYCPKASKKDRGADNKHPTVKPTALMRYLCRLITPPNGVVLDPYMGSGSTGKAAIKEGFGFIGIEIDEDYHEIAKARIVA